MKASAPLTLSLLGGFRLATGSGSAVRLPSRKGRALLAYLALRPGHRHSRNTLAALLWGDMGDEQARANLRHELFTLRRVLGRHAGALVLDAEEVAIDPAGVETDVARFERAAAAGPDGLAAAADLYRGELLEGLGLREAAFEDWLRGERERLRGLALDVLERWLVASASAGRFDDALEAGGRALAVDPLRESVHRALMRAHAGRGARAEAARQYRVCAEILRRELGTEPDPETTRLYRELMAEPAAVSPPRRPGRSASPVVGAASPAVAGPALVGRSGEMARLGRLVGAGMSGTGRVLLVLGEAGIGKTRLVEELVARGQQAGARVVTGHVYQSDSEFALSAWVEALRSALAGDEDVLAGVGAPYRAELASLVPELGEAETPAESAGPMRLFEAVGRVVDRWAAAAPLILVIEDVHWADEATLRLFTAVARRIPRLPALLVATARDEEPEYVARLQPVIADLTRAGVLEKEVLGALGRQDTDALARSLAGQQRDADLASLLEAVWRTSEGNPLGVVEAMRAYREGTLDARAPGSSLPEPVRMLIAQRLDRLDVPTRRVLEAAAVIGRTFELALLERAAGLEPAAALDLVEELVRRRLLDDRGGRLDFSHDRIREVTYAAILPSRRRALHGQAATAIESLYGDRLDDHVHALAMHCREMGAWEKAVRYFCRAGQVTVLRGASRQAVGCYEEALSALAEMPDSPERLALAVDARLGCGHALIPLGEPDRLGRYVAEAQAMCERLEDHRRLVNVLLLKTRYTLIWKDPPDVLAAAEHAHAVAERSTDPEQVGDAAYCLSLAAYFVGDERRAVAIARRCIEQGLDETRPGALFTAPREVQLRAVLAQSLVELGDLAEAEAVAATALEIATRYQRPFPIIIGSMAVGLVALGRRDAAAAATAFERATSVGQAAGFTLFAQTAPGGLALARARLGAADEAIAVLETLVRQTRGVTTRLWMTFPSLWLAEAYLLAGRLADARLQAEAALGLAKARGERTLEGWLLWLLGEIGSRTEHGGAASALGCYEAALAIAATGGLRPLQARCQVGVARVHARAGRLALAREGMAAAQALFRALRLPAQLTEADEALLR